MTKYNREYYAANRKELDRAHRQWFAANPGREAEYQEKSRAKQKAKSAAEHDASLPARMTPACSECGRPRCHPKPYFKTCGYATCQKSRISRLARPARRRQYAKDPGKSKREHQAWAEANRAHLLAYGRRYRTANRDRINRYLREWRAANADKVAAHQRIDERRRRLHSGAESRLDSRDLDTQRQQVGPRQRYDIGHG